jgi:hypothetical protein
MKKARNIAKFDEKQSKITGNTPIIQLIVADLSQISVTNWLVTITVFYYFPNVISGVGFTSGGCCGPSALSESF